MRRKAEQGFVTGGKLFGYDNVRVGKGQTTRVVNEAEAAVIREIYAATPRATACAPSRWR